MSLFTFLFGRKPRVSTDVIVKQMDDTVARAKRNAEIATRRIAQSAGVNEEDIRSETLRIMAGRPPQYGDLLRDLVRPPSKGNRSYGHD